MAPFLAQALGEHQAEVAGKAEPHCHEEGDSQGCQVEGGGVGSLVEEERSKCIPGEEGGDGEDAPRGQPPRPGGRPGQVSARPAKPQSARATADAASILPEERFAPEIVRTLLHGLAPAPRPTGA